MQLKMGGKFHLKLNIGERPIEKDEKHFGKRVKQYVKLLKGKRLKSVVSGGIQPSFCLVYFSSDGSASISTGGERRGECGCLRAVL
jgi:hypothetical protein